MNRRQALQGLVALAATKPTAPAAAKPEVLTDHQDRTVDALAELILPRTETPGARDAQVYRYIDRMLKEGLPPEERATFLAGLDQFDAACRRSHGRPFADLSVEQQTAALMALGENDRFFRQMKDLTLRGYYTSREGLLQELEYKGNKVYSEYPGCTHPEHRP